MVDNSASFYKNSPGNPNQIVNPTPASFYTETAAFNLVYYGARASHPTIDPFGQPVITGALYYDTTRNGLFVFDGTNWRPYAATSSTLEFIVDGQGAAPSPGTVRYLEVPYDCTVIQFTLVSDNVVGSVSLYVRVVPLATFNPPTRPGSGDSITGMNPPTLVASASKRDQTLTNWTTNLTQGDILGIAVVSASTITNATLSLKIVRR